MLDIVVNNKEGYVYINGSKVSGFKEESLCNNCNRNRYYSAEYDAYYCPHCNSWLEEACTDPDCQFCSDRPNSPSSLWE